MFDFIKTALNNEIIMFQQMDLKINWKSPPTIDENGKDNCDSTNIKTTPPSNINPLPKYYPFRLPIDYQCQTQKQDLNHVVINDLELVNSEQTSMYDILFQPTNEFSKNMIQEWKKTISTDEQYLKETQSVIENIGLINEKQIEEKDATDATKTKTKTQKLLDIWKDLKEDPHFLEKYSYMEFEWFKSLNHSSAFLQTVTIGNFVSPLVSLLIPIVFFILPFVILKFRGDTIGFSTYIHVLKDLAKHHFIGKTIHSLENFDWNQIGYVAITIILYFLQIYNNIVSCCRFYNNIKRVNEQMLFLRGFLQTTTDTMKLFVNMHESKKTYRTFCEDVKKYSHILEKMESELVPISPFHHSPFKIGQTGYLLKCYYHFYSNEEYGDALRFSFGFNGYMDNISNVFDKWKKGEVQMWSSHTPTTDDNETIVYMKNQYYAPHGKELSVKNNFTMKKTKRGAIITGPNGSGKTTFLKTTAINIILTQQLGVGFYTKCHLKPFKYIHSYLNIPDTSGRDSLFQAESRRCKEIIDSVVQNTDNHFCIFDELYSGTNPVEATKASCAFLKYLSKFDNVSFLLTTHYVDVCKKMGARKKPDMVEEGETAKPRSGGDNIGGQCNVAEPRSGGDNIENYKMDVKISENNSNDFIFTYKLKKGISTIEGAFNVLKSMNYPREFLDFFANSSF
jgi:energy-coupling factor transporter ATP-binding protein EcfA2